MMRKFLMPAVATAMLAGGAAQAHSPSLAGVWQTSITLVNCSSGQALAPPFTSLLSFAGNGTESEATNNPALQPGQRTTGFGVWSHKGGNNFHMDTYALILFTTSGPPPIQAGSQQIHQDITLSGKNWTSVATVQFYDTSGNLVASGCATAAATLLP